MMKIMEGLPENVLGVAAEGKVTGRDYETVFIPALDTKFETHKKMRLLYQLGDSFDGFEVSAMLDDAKVGMKHLSSWDRVAVVSDHETMNGFVKFFAHIIPCEVRIFKNADLEGAKKWIAE